MKENQSLKQQIKKVNEKYEKQQITLEHLKNNIENQRYMGGNGRDDDPLNLDGSIDLPT